MKRLPKGIIVALSREIITIAGKKREIQLRYKNRPEDEILQPNPVGLFETEPRNSERSLTMGPKRMSI